jgi:S1-C subfamily serine protease
MRAMRRGALGLALAGAVLTLLSARAQDVDRRLLEAEARRIATVEKVTPSVVAIFATGGQGGGSGVLISKDGYALTNYHVVHGTGPVMQAGLPDGVLYDAVLVGLDKVGDVALIKLLPQKEGQDFPAAALGDSDKVRAGDWSLAMGNPFLLATDFKPTVTFGLVSGVHRYQYPAGTLLEYTDCIQVDTSINPGNSGGPLFNLDGELIGINGRGSFDKRGRVNCGVGYAISINQIKNFLGHLRGGLDTDHATLGATIRGDTEEGASVDLVVDAIIEDCDAHRRGLDVDDELVSFAGRPMTSVNQFKNVLGIFPKGWRVPLVYRRKNEKHEILVRLMQLQQTQGEEEGRKPHPAPGPARPTPAARSPATKLYEPKPGFANYHFNRLERDGLAAAFRGHGGFGALDDWSFDAEGKGKDRTALKLALREVPDEFGPDGRPAAREGTYHLNPVNLPSLPETDDAQTTPLRLAVTKADALLRKHAHSFPQDVWAAESDARTREKAGLLRGDAAGIRKLLEAALQDLKKVERAQEKVAVWQAHYDFMLARVSAFIAYLHEYDALLEQFEKELPRRDPKMHRGWHMEPAESMHSEAGRKLAALAQLTWERMIGEYKGSRWAELAREGRQTQLGLRWAPTGGTKPVVRLTLGAVKYDLEPLKLEQDIRNLQEPPGSGGLMEAFYQYHRLLMHGPAGFEGYCYYGGYEPFYPPAADGKPATSVADSRVDTEVLMTEHAAVPVKWYFSRSDHTLLGFEVTPGREGDPCEVYLSDYRKVGGRMLPFRIEVWHGNEIFGAWTVKAYQVASK